MRKNKPGFITSICLGLFLFWASMTLAQNSKPRLTAPIKVASIGNSVTFGAGIAERENNSYPAQLQKMLGENYLVENFGKNGATLLKNGHNPYYKTNEFLKSIDFKADIAVIHLGLNDTDPRNWPSYGDEFEMDYAWLIDTLRSSNPSMEIFISKLSPIFAGHPRFLSSTLNWYWQIQSLIPSIAEANKVKLIDFYATLSNRPDLLPDNLHPTAQGATKLAETVFHAIKGYSKGFTVDAIYGDHMVLQRNQAIPIQGKASTGSTVIASIIDTNQKSITSSTTADQQGNWQVLFPEMKAGGPYEIILKNEQFSHRFIDVLVGDVWIASGQSNMYFPLSQSEDPTMEINHAAEKTQLRFLKYKPLVETKNTAWKPEELEQINALDYFTGTWKRSNAKSVNEFSAIAYYFAKNVQAETGVPIGVIELAVGGSPLLSWVDRLSLEQDPLLANAFKNWRQSDYIQAWCRERADKNLENTENTKQRHPFEPAYNFEAGVAKLTHFPIRGLLWYQGESDAHNAELFEKIFPVFVNSWRKHWKQNFPIYHVQLSSVDRPSWPHFRVIQQKLTQEIPKTYMAVSSDLGNREDVHPIQKEAVGIRLANLALHHTYGLDMGETEGPIPLKAAWKNKKIELSFEHAEGLKTGDGLSLRGFKLKTKKGRYVFPQSCTIKNNKVILSLSTAQTDSLHLMEVLYGWEGYSDANLVNSSGLPASTFRINIQ